MLLLLMGALTKLCGWLQVISYCHMMDSVPGMEPDKVHATQDKWFLSNKSPIDLPLLLLVRHHITDWMDHWAR